MTGSKQQSFHDAAEEFRLLSRSNELLCERRKVERCWFSSNVLLTKVCCTSFTDCTQFCKLQSLKYKTCADNEINVFNHLDLKYEYMLIRFRKVIF